jgi:parallel beta-helix repeat protein
MPAQLQRRARAAALASLAAISALTLAVTIASAGTSPPATNVSCGETITADTTLDGDLADCPNEGIVIGADDVTIDLNGHTIAGDGKPVKNCPKEPCDVGVLNEGHDGVTVRNGALHGFGVGIFTGKATHGRVLHVASSGNQFFGLVFIQSNRSVVRDSSADDNPAPDGDGIGLFGSRHVRILNSSFRRNGLGIHVSESSLNTIDGNRFSRNGDFAILMQGNRNLLRHNRCVANGACINVAPGNRNVIAGNRVRGGDAGISVEKGHGNLLLRNLVEGTSGDGIYLGLDDPPIGGRDSVLRRNVVRRSGRNGFFVSSHDNGSRLIGNIATGAAKDGFHVASSSARLRRNRATHNGDLGIEAVLGVTDAGRNIARHNGDARQCTHIICG